MTAIDEGNYGRIVANTVHAATGSYTCMSRYSNRQCLLAGRSCTSPSFTSCSILGSEYMCG